MSEILFFLFYVASCAATGWIAYTIGRVRGILDAEDTQSRRRWQEQQNEREGRPRPWGWE